MFETEGEGEETVVEDEGAGEETPPEPEPEETPASGLEDIGKTTLDRLFAGERPDWLSAQLEVSGEDAAAPTDEELAALPHEAKRAVAAIVRGVDRRTAAERERQQALDARETQLGARERLATQRMADALRWGNDPDVRRRVAEVKGEEEPAEGTPEHAKWVGRQAAAEMMEEFFGVIGQADQRYRAEYAAAERAAAEEAHVAAGQAYINQHLEDFQDPELFKAISKLVVNHGHTLQEAHEIAVARALGVDRAEREQQTVIQAGRKLAQERIANGGRGNSGLPKMPADLSFTEQLEWYEKHPDALRQRVGQGVRAKPPKPGKARA